MATVAVTGSTGFIGTALCAHLRSNGHTVLRLVRGDATAADAIAWDPATGTVDAAIARADAVVHLAGENVAAGRWTEKRRRRIADSRGPATLLLCKTLADLPRPPVLLSASAVGIYGSRGDEVLTEDSAPGAGFLAEVTSAWEAGTAPLQRRGARVAFLRIGLVLGRGGALARMLPVFRLGLGGPLGNGRQFVSWIALADLLRIVDFLLARDDAHGPFLCVGPTPVTNREFTKALGRHLRRPTFCPVPAFALRALFGALADEALLASQRAVAARLVKAGFEFRHGDVAGAIAASLA